MKRSGFTLIELSIVLIIIGLIIGGVMKGKDLIASAEQKKVYNTWLKQWQVLANEYQDRTGAVLGDGTANGGNQGSEDGIVDRVQIAGMPNVVTAIENVGLTKVDGLNNGISQQLKGKLKSSTVSMQLWNSPEGNSFFIQNMPIDMAVAFDKMMDGKADPLDGNFRRYNSTATTWPAVNSGNGLVTVYILQ